MSKKKTKVASQPEVLELGLKGTLDAPASAAEFNQPNMELHAKTTDLGSLQVAHATGKGDCQVDLPESACMTNEGAEALASQVLEQIDAICIKLRELKPQLEQLRGCFQGLSKSKGTIAGCRTWNEFCTTKLHRTRRAVNGLLSGAKAEPEVMHEPDEWEVSSHPDAVSGEEEFFEDAELHGEAGTFERQTDLQETDRSTAMNTNYCCSGEDVDAETLGDLKDLARRAVASFRLLTKNQNTLRNSLIGWLEDIGFQVGFSVAVIVADTIGRQPGHLEEPQTVQ